ncbi:MAG TPA: DUF3536 domain-containing protein [Syntrophorhabdaceae bacterium]|jgi:alpha-amylase/alpha-mannosidase (GH57 family)
MDRYVCIHGHFYQPPRENPWLEAVEVQDSAYPFHDWNDRIDAECYAPNTASRITGGDGGIIDIVNNYSRISFNFGPTLLSWMEVHAPETYGAVLEADRVSMERFSGHGSAIAQAYNHLIMPLANRSDKRTQVLWGIKDFVHRFHREPEGMWLPETAVDLETLEVLAEQGIKFTVLAPRQAHQVRDLDDVNGWQSVDGEAIDPTMVYSCPLPSGKSINLFFYDGPISRGIAFEDILKQGESFANRLIGAFNDDRTWDQLVHIATDGETYGHHHHFGDMALAYALHHIESNNLAKVTVYGEYLEHHPPTRAVEIYENSSWSCAHGVLRWKENCGCNSGMHQGWHQKWRKPLRESLDWLRDKALPVYEKEAGKYLKNPWRARDEYIDVVLDPSEEKVSLFLEEHSVRPLSDEEKVRALQLLLMQRCAMLMYTSCGWFFDEISGIETVQVIQYAARMIQLLDGLGQESPVEPEFVAMLAKAPGNVVGDGAKVYELYVKPAKVDILRVAAHYIISSLFMEYPEQGKRIYSFTIDDEVFDTEAAGKMKLAIGRGRVRSDWTWDEACLNLAAVYMGDHNVSSGVKEFETEEKFNTMHDEVMSAFKKGDVAEMVRTMDRHFPSSSNFNLWHLFRDQQRFVINEILKDRYDGIMALYRTIYEDNYSLMAFLQSLRNPVPPQMRLAAEQTLNDDLETIFRGDVSVEKLSQLVEDTKKWEVQINAEGISLAAGTWIHARLHEVARDPEGPDMIPLMEKVSEALQVLEGLPLHLDLWRAQNVYFTLRKEKGEFIDVAAKTGNEDALRREAAFRKLGESLHIKL